MPATKPPARKKSAAGTGPTARARALQAFLEALPGAVAVPVTAPRGVVPVALMFKIMGRMFAVLSVRGDEYVVLKCEPDQAVMLRAQYDGIGHRTHIDPRHWIAVRLDGDVPGKEIERLAAESYARVSAGLTRKQQAELAALRD